MSSVQPGRFRVVSRDRGSRLTLAAAVVLAGVAGAHAAPKVEWVKGEAHQLKAFQIDVSRAHAVQVFEIRGGFDTKAEAEAEVRRLIAIDAQNTRNANDHWRFAIIRVTERPRTSVKEDVESAINGLRDLYRKVSQIREKEFAYWVAGASVSTPESRAEVNRAITYYNGELRAVRGRYGAEFERRAGQTFRELQLLGDPPKQQAAPQAGGAAAIDLSGNWNTERIEGASRDRYTGSMSLRRSGAGYEGEWSQRFMNQYGGQVTVVQDVTVTVNGNGVTVQGRNPRVVKGSTDGYFADTEYFTIESPTSLVGRGVDAGNQKGSSRMWR